ncbi:RpsU-divergently transcribed [Sphingorhabdus lutea]|uniref:RpsU-divergently transcribed n=1 Tax=Sphingorhabdus lutea TaxID=1913578 RepID=A0A1L3JEI8_9SPHN|nr:COQ9 family protein [Sphingorhabdus lutea]APG63463.1 RpsU-divergently transcribed [Sphingorhabdus lutea]
MTDAKNDLTLTEIRDKIALILPKHAAFDGWTNQAVLAAAAEIGVDGDVAILAFPAGAIDMVICYIGGIDAEMARRLPPEKIGSMKIRDRISALIQTRLDIMAPYCEAQRRAMAILAMPSNLSSTAKIGWRTADRMWRMAGDESSDFNHYTKRMTLSAVYGSTLAVFINDESENFAETKAFLSRRIDNVMQFEKAKAGWKARSENMPSLSRLIGRMRYPAK